LLHLLHWQPDLSSATGADWTPNGPLRPRIRRPGVRHCRPTASCPLSCKRLLSLPNCSGMALARPLVEITTVGGMAHVATRDDRAPGGIAAARWLWLDDARGPARQ